MPARPRRVPRSKSAETYLHPDADLPMRPEVGTQAQFKKKKPPQTYRYDSSLSPSLEWDGRNPAREAGEALLKQIHDLGLMISDLALQPSSAQRDRQIINHKSSIINLTAQLKSLSKPFLNWSGKAERLSFAVPTLPLFIHERLTNHESRNTPQYQVELLGLDVFDPISMEVDHQSGNDVPAWLLDTNYNGLCFHVGQAFFPRTGAWENLKKALKGDYEASVWDHLAGTVSAPFVAGEHGQVAVKVIDQRGNELLVVKSLKEAGK